MILLDSSGWLEILEAGPLAHKFEGYLKKTWLVSTINLFEVYRKLARRSEDKALQAIAFMRKGHLHPVDETVALEAGDLSIKYKLAMADSLVLATAFHYKADLVTKDNDFRNIPRCKVID